MSKWKYTWLLSLILLAFSGCTPASRADDPEAQQQTASQEQSKDKPSSNSSTPDEQQVTLMSKEEAMSKSEEEWKEELTPEEFQVLRQAGTERAFSGEYYDLKDDGTYVCAACGQELFSSKDKFKSGTGWPSYTKAIEDGRVEERVDSSHGMRRVEVVCGRCGGHLGHVFNDGPAPTGQRYCINSVALQFVPEDGE